MDKLIRITKEFRFETGHALYGYDGLCKNVHGHSYKLSVSLVGAPISDPKNVKFGMLIDFSDLKKIIKHIQSLGSKVVIFIDPEIEMLEYVKDYYKVDDLALANFNEMFSFFASLETDNRNVFSRNGSASGLWQIHKGNGSHHTALNRFTTLMKRVDPDFQIPQEIEDAYDNKTEDLQELQAGGDYTMHTLLNLSLIHI